MAITLKIGSPVEGADFYGRQRELEVAQRRLLGNNLMLSAPRRVGKTSFARKLLTCMKEQGWNTIFLNLEGINSVPAFFQTIYNELLELPNIKKHQQLVAKIKQAIERFSSLLMTLENDGYIGKTDSRRFFRSPLLRDYWKRKFCE